MSRPLTVVLATILVIPSFASAQAPGDRARLDATRHDGVPVHLVAGDNSYVRWANGTIADVIAIDATTVGSRANLRQNEGLPLNQDRERALNWSKDLGRSLDYLETRPDIDIKKVGLYGVSTGATHGVWMTAVHRRIQAAVLASGGLFRNQPAETDSWNFAPRVRAPVLMLNGRDDFMVPYETNQRVLFEALGSKDKNFSRYDGGHANLLTRPDLIGEVLDWFDKYLGPVNQQP